MHEQITSRGWAWHGFCNCGGKARKYKKGGLTLKHWEKQGRWSLVRGNKTLERGIDQELISRIDAQV